jgi:AraC-like DNA-binding protein
MPDWSIRRGIASVRRLARVAVENGASLDACLEGTGIAASALDKDEAEISADQELRLIRNVVRWQPQTETLSIEAGLRLKLTDTGIWGYALISSRTLREAVLLSMRYRDLSDIFGDIRFEESGGEGRIFFDYQRIPSDIRLFVIERDMATLAAVQRQVCGLAVPVQRVCFAFPKPRHAARIKAHFGVVPEYDADATMIVVDAQALDHPLPQANEATRRMCELECARLLARRTARTGVSAKVRDLILRRPDEAPDMERVAAELCITARTLRRHLVREGTTFRALREEVLLMLAEELLGTARMKLDEVARRLGYSDSASFSHAFKRWKGATPGSLRAA